MTMEQVAQDVRRLVREGIDAERRRCIGVVLEEVGIRQLAGQDSIARALDALAVKLEYPEGQ